VPERPSILFQLYLARDMLLEFGDHKRHRFIDIDLTRDRLLTVLVDTNKREEEANNDHKEKGLYCTPRARCC
jgi:hypothetical protein